MVAGLLVGWALPRLAVAFAFSAATSGHALQGGDRSDSGGVPQGLLQSAPVAFTSARFQRIEDVEVDRYGNAYVLDSKLNHVVVVDARGHPRQILGRSGLSPGQFARPLALALDSTGRLLVLDPRAMRLTVFVHRDTLELDRTYAIGFEAWDLCAVGERIFLLGLRDGRIVHEVHRSGDSLAPVHDFGDAFAGHPRLAERLARGKLACFSSPGAIVVASPLLPEVRAYRLDGVLLWSTRLQGHVGVKFEQRGPGTIGMRSGGSWLQQHHATNSVFPWTRELVAVNLALVRRERGWPTSREVAWDTRLLSVRSGKEISQFRSKFGVAARRGNRAFGFINEAPGSHLFLVRL